MPVRVRFTAATRAPLPGAAAHESDGPRAAHRHRKPIGTYTGPGRLMIYFTLALVWAVVGFFVFARWGSRWGSTAEERSRRMPGDVLLEGSSATRALRPASGGLRDAGRSLGPELYTSWTKAHRHTSDRRVIVLASLSVANWGQVSEG